MTAAFLFVFSDKKNLQRAAAPVVLDYAFFDYLIFLSNQLETIFRRKRITYKEFLYIIFILPLLIIFKKNCQRIITRVYTISLMKSS
jgi:hypothetical protein